MYILLKEPYFKKKKKNVMFRKGRSTLHYSMKKAIKMSVISISIRYEVAENKSRRI